MDNLTDQMIKYYRVAEKLGEGGMASVYRAVDTRLGRSVALKIILPEIASEKAFRKRFDREVRVLSQLSHPNIVGIIDYGEHEQTPYFVMEYLSGGSLKQRIGQPIPFQEAARLLLPIAKALAHAHQQGIIHRDIKPSNILFSDSGEPMLSDFGVARMAQSKAITALTDTGFGIGTPEYMAPEQASGGEVDQRADIYSLGIVFYELLTGKRPFEGETPFATMLEHANAPLPRPRESVRRLPRAVEKALYKALAKDPADRFANMEAFAKVLEKLAQGDLKLGLDVKLPAPRRWWVVGIGAIAALIFLSGLLWSNFNLPGISSMMTRAAGSMVEPTSTFTVTPSVTLTSSPTFTITPSVTSTLTPSLTPTNPHALIGTPVYIPQETISPENAGRIIELAQMGTGITRLRVSKETSNPYLGYVPFSSQLFKSPDHQKVAGATSLGVALFDAETGEVIRIMGTDTWVRQVLFSPNGEMIASICIDDSVQVWNINDGSLLFEIQGSQSAPLIEATNRLGSVQLALANYFIHENHLLPEMVFSPDSQTLAVGLSDGTVDNWNIENEKLVQKYMGLDSKIWSLAFSPYGDKLAAGSVDGVVALWNVANGDLIWSIDEQLQTSQNINTPITALAFSPATPLIAVSTNRDQPGVDIVRVRDVISGTLVQAFSSETKFDTVNILTFSDDGEYVASHEKILGISTWDISIWDISNGTRIPWNEIRMTLTSYSYKDIQFNYDITSWQGLGFKDDRSTKNIEGFAAEFPSIVRFSPTGDRLAYGSTIFYIPDISGYSTSTYSTHNSDEVNYWMSIIDITFTPDLENIYVGSFGDNYFYDDSGIFRWEKNGNSLIRSSSFFNSYFIAYPGISMPDDAHSPPALSPDGKLIAANHGMRRGAFFYRGYDYVGFTQYRSPAKENLIMDFGYHDPDARFIFSEDGKTLAAARRNSDDETVMKEISLWDTGSWSSISSLPIPEEFLGSQVYDLRFSQNNQYFAAMLGENSIVVWDVPSKKVVSILDDAREPGLNGIHFIDFSPTGNLLAAGSQDRLIYLWQIPEGKLVGTLSGHRDPIYSLDISPNGDYLASYSTDGTIRLWGVGP
jgi:serine/threonine protein kinase/WD40 repeat protein